MRRQSKRNRQHHQGRREREMRKKRFHCPPPEFRVFEIPLQGACQGAESVSPCKQSVFSKCPPLTHENYAGTTASVAGSGLVFRRGSTRVLSPSDRPEHPWPQGPKERNRSSSLGVLILLYNLKKGAILHDLPEFKFLRRGLTSDMFGSRDGRRLVSSFTVINSHTALKRFPVFVSVSSVS